MREWRGRTGDVSGKGRRKSGCKDGGVQAAEVGRALGSTCPQPRAAALARQRQVAKKIAAQLPTTGRDRRGRCPPEVIADWLTSACCKAPARAYECGMVMEHLKPIHVGRSNGSTHSLPCSWSAHAMSFGDFIAPPRLPLHGSGSSRCAGTVCKPLWLWPCTPLTVLRVPCHVATATARRRHSA